MRIDKLTSKLQTALADAQSIAVGKDHNFIEPVHLMQALLDQEGSAIKPLLKQAGAEPGRIRQAIAREIETCRKCRDRPATSPCPMTWAGCSTLPTSSPRNAKTSISSELMLLAALEDRGTLAGCSGAGR